MVKSKTSKITGDEENWDGLWATSNTLNLFGRRLRNAQIKTLKKILTEIEHIKNVLRFIRIAKNWHKSLLACAGITVGLIKREKNFVECRNGMKFFTNPDKTDLGVIVTVLDMDDYKLPRRITTVVDIGGHIGVFTILAAKYAERVFVYEPCPENYSLLKENIEVNNCNNVIPYQYAVAKEDGVQKFYLSEMNTGSHSLNSFQNGSKFLKVKTTTLKEIFELNRIDKISFLKMDCEGCEYEVLSNLPKEYFNRIDEIALEYHYGHGDKILEILERNSFNVKRSTGIIHGYKL